MNPTLKKTSFISPRRIGIIASHTFTLLVRMKVFYFLIIFALLFWVLKQYVFGSVTGGDAAAEQELRLIKSTGFFAMNLFAIVMAIAATALLIPKDIEDRTLYTILCKPVPRLDYLIGKLMGVLLLIFVSLLLMDILISYSLYSNTSRLLEQEAINYGSAPPEFLQARLSELQLLGDTSNVHYAAITIFFKAAVIASIALLISTFSSSTIFTLILTILVVLIGLIQADAREYVLRAEEFGKDSMITKISAIVAVVFPDFQFMNIDDGIINGSNAKLAKEEYSIFGLTIKFAGLTVILFKIIILAIFYISIYTILAWFTFRKKEF